MTKLLFFLLIGGIVYWRLRYRSRVTRPATSARPIENMVRCKHCGMHLPCSEAIGTEAAWFCSEAHRQEYRA
ncbi:MAG: PP0621 family protein [Sulfuriferula sp.]